MVIVKETPKQNIPIPRDDHASKNGIRLNLPSEATKAKNVSPASRLNMQRNMIFDFNGWS